MEIYKLNVVGLGRHDDGTAWEGGKEPEGVQLIVAKGLGCIIITHGVSFDLVPHLHVVEKKLTIGKGA